MSEPFVIPPGGGEVVGDSPDRRVEILCDHDALHVTWSRFGPGRDGADLHVHHRHTDLFYVLAGELTVRLGVDGEAVAVPKGNFVRVPPMVVHGFRNASDAELRYLNFHAPGVGFADYMRGLRDGRRVPFDQEPPPAEGIRPASEAAIGAGEIDTAAIAISAVGTDGGGSPPVDAGQVQCLYLLEGSLEVTLGDRHIDAPAGSWIQLPAGVPHSVAIRGPARYLRVQAPRTASSSALGQSNGRRSR
jgi:mannose-6-phosphate isomerase-like protein (cupin superfamily)